MPTEKEYKQALIKAHNAGDTQAAELFASKIKELRQQTPKSAGQFAQSSTQAQTQRAPAIQDGNFIDAVIEPLKSIGTSIAGTSYGGLKGIADLLSGGDIDSAVNALRQTQIEMSSQPKTKSGNAALGQITKALQTIERGVNSAAGGTAGLLNVALNPVSNIQQGFEPAKQEASAIIDQGLGRAAGQEALNVTGSPFAATAVEMTPSVAELAAGAGSGRLLDDVSPSAMPKTKEDLLVESGKDLNVPLLTSDVYPPNSFMGKWMQGMSEKLGVLGSGAARQSQQNAREATVQQLSDEFDVSMDSPLFDTVIKSLTAKNAKRLEVANLKRRNAIDKLSEYGAVSFPRTEDAVLSVVGKEQRLGSKSNNSVINEAQAFFDAVQGKNFDEAAAIRTRLIQQQKDLESSQSETKTPMISALNTIKKAMDDDLNEFAKSNDRGAAANWLSANKNLAESLTEVKQSELKRLIEKGDVKPELISTILFGGKRSELQRLARNIGEKGRESARAAVVRNMLDKSGFFSGDVNPNRLATQIGKTNNKQAIDVLFSDNQKKQLDSLERLLDATRRAQDASVSTRTGEQLLPMSAAGGFGYVASNNPFIALGTAATMSGVLKAYESKPFRQLLMKIARTKKGSAEEKRILEYAIPAVLAAQQAAKEQQQIDLVASR